MVECSIEHRSASTSTVEHTKKNRNTTPTPKTTHYSRSKLKQNKTYEPCESVSIAILLGATVSAVAVANALTQLLTHTQRDSRYYKSIDGEPYISHRAHCIALTHIFPVFKNTINLSERR